MVLCLTLLTSDIIRAMELGSQCDVVYTDFSKAFDKVNHKILIQKLIRFNLPQNLLIFLNNFLQFRS